MYDHPCDCRFDDSVPDCIADDKVPLDSLVWYGGRPSVLHDLCEPYFCDHECIEAEYDAADRVCDRHGADLPLFKYPDQEAV